MELTSRKAGDIYVPAGAFRQLRERLRTHPVGLSDLSAVVFACWDPQIRKLPFVIYDRYIFPAGPRSIAGTLHDCGITNTRCVYQLWNPRFRPSRCRMNGRVPDMLLLSSMGHSSAQAYTMIADAWELGEQRPLILCGGPKAIYQPYDFWPIATRHGNVGPDAVVTGEAYVLVDLLNVLAEFRLPGEPIRLAFERARRAGALDDVPGLIYLSPEATLQEPRLVDTGLQRLVQSFDEFPDEAVNLGLLEPPHRGKGLSAEPLSAKGVGRRLRIATIQLTQGCKFSCSYCPIPAVNQKTWRFRSPEGVVRQMGDLYSKFRIRYLFGTDDNFMNKRQTAVEMLEALARAKTGSGRNLGQRIRWGTEATQFDTYKNQDLLPLARRAGLAGIWFGIEDLTAELINKGQKPEKTLELFRLLHANDIAPMAMIMYHDGQPFYSPNSLYGLSNQVRFLRDAGAISLQCTVLSPAWGTKGWEDTFKSGVMSEVGGLKLGDRHHDGNYVIVKGRESPLSRQLKWLGGYWTFYNPVNLLKAMRKDGSPLRLPRAAYQVVGMVAALRTTLKTIPFLMRLLLGKPRYHEVAPAPVPLPVELAPNAFSRYPAEVPLPRRRQRKAA